MAWASDGARRGASLETVTQCGQFSDGHRWTAVHAGLDSALAVASATGAVLPTVCSSCTRYTTEAESTCWEGMNDATRVGSRSNPYETLLVTGNRGRRWGRHRPRLRRGDRHGTVFDEAGMGLSDLLGVEPDGRKVANGPLERWCRRLGVALC